ncbi:hypothetical protein BCF59_0712 [Mycoplasmopsis mustelae]|uniref:Uncharacterized protein n=1 Tax=Mycoplasmopsis mustelae TaxID=171289 RepID=A0A4R7UDY6_9BACT|nr:hypothetical protein [Mycoplasmopsis mustelae]TDV22863.1 hypothetical protein BCF59_0712 [Mycoplasmopsis mustelae]
MKEAKNEKKFMSCLGDVKIYWPIWTGFVVGLVVILILLVIVRFA